jgi:hypothetical protein
MIVIYNKHGNPERHSKNLRGLRAYAARVRAIRVNIGYRDTRSNGLLKVFFEDGSTCQCEFESFQVLCGWIGRWLKVRGAKLFVNGSECGVVDRNNIYLKGTAYGSGHVADPKTAWKV